jgi:hypothetical protein
MAGLLETADLAFFDLPDREWPPTSYEAIARIHVRCVELVSSIVGSA